MLEPQKGLGHRHQLKFALSGLSSKDLEQPSVAAARQVLRAVSHNKQHLSTALLDVLTGTESVPKHAAKSRLQLAEYAVLECLCQQQLIQVLPRLSQQANVVLAAHRQDAGCINSLAALLTSCVAKLLLEPQGSYAAIHGRATAHHSTEAVTADFLCEALLFTVIKSTYRDPEQTRVSAGSVVLLALFEVLKGHTDQPAVLEAVRRCLGLMLQLMAAGIVAQRAPGVLLPVCSCVEVLGLSLDKDSTRRLIKLALKAATVQHSWQVRRDACQALATLAASLQFRTLPALGDRPSAAAAAQPELVLTPAVELLIAQKPAVVQVLDDVRYDKIAAVRATAAAAWAEFTALPDPPAADDATPAGKSDKEGGSSTKLRSAGSNATKGGAGHKALQQRKRPPPPRFVRPKLLPDGERDFGVLVFAPPYPPPSPPSSPPPGEAADTSQTHGADQSPVARQLLFEAGTSARASMDAASQTQTEPLGVQQQAYTVQSPLSAGSNPFFATSSSPSPGHSMGPEELQQQLQQQLHHQLQQQQQPGLPALLAATGFGGSPVRLDISHHVHGRVEVGISYSAGGSPGPATQTSTGAQPASPATTPAAGHAMPDGSTAAAAAAGLLSAMAAAAVQPGSPDIRHSLQTIHPLWDPQQEQQQWQQQQGAWATSSTEEMVFEPSFGQPGCATASLNGLVAAGDIRTAGLSPAGGSPGSISPVGVSAADTAHDNVLRGPTDGHEVLGTDMQEAPPHADSGSPLTQPSEHARRQRQRWQLAPLSCPSDQDGSEPASRHCTPSEQRTPRSPNSLEVLRNVGERVQHLLESLSRQTSNSSRQGSRSPVAQSAGAPLQGPPTQPGAPPVLNVARSSSCLSSSSAVSARTAGSASEGAAATGSAEPVDVSLRKPQGHQQLHTLLQEKLASVDDQQTLAANQHQILASVPWAASQPLDDSSTQESDTLHVGERCAAAQQHSHASQVQEPSSTYLAAAVQQDDMQQGLDACAPSGAARSSGVASTALQLQEQQQLELPASSVAVSDLLVDNSRPQQEPWHEQQRPSQLLREGCSTPVADLPLNSLQPQGPGRGDAAAAALQQQHDYSAAGVDASIAGAADCADASQAANTADAGVSSNSKPNLQDSSQIAPLLKAAPEGLRTAAAGQPQLEAIFAASDLGFTAAPSKVQCLPQSASDDAEVYLVSTPRQQAAGIASLQQQQLTLQEECPAVQQQLTLQEECPAVQQQLTLQEECPAVQQELQRQIHGAVVETVPQDSGYAWQQGQAAQAQQEACRLSLHEPAGPQQQPNEEQLQMLSAAAAPPAGPGSLNMLYNELFQPCAEVQHDANVPAWPLSTLGLQDGQAVAAFGSAAHSLGTMLDGREGSLALAALPTQAEAGGMSRVDKALEKLNSLRSTLRTISSSGAEPSSLPVSARASLAGSRAASTALGTREHSSSGLTLPPLGPPGVLQERSMGGSLTGLTAVPVSASTVLQAPAGTSIALASAKDWIREISERLQHVGVHEPLPEAAVPGSAQASQPSQAVEQPPSCTQQAAPDAALQETQCMEPDPAAGVVLTMPTASDGSVGAGAARQGSSSHGDPAAAAEDPWGAGTAARPSYPVMDNSTPDAAQALPAAVGRNMTPGGLPVSACDVASHTAQLQESLAGSQGWSTLTAGSSSGSVGSEHLGNLVQEQLQASRSSGPTVAALPAAAGAGAVAAPDSATPVAGSQADAWEPAGSAHACTLQQAHEQLERQLPDSNTQEAEVQLQAHPTAELVGGVLAGHAEASLLGAARALWAPADEAAAALVTSEQRLQQLLQQDDHTVLLMSFALKLDRLGRTYKAPSQGLLSHAGADTGGRASNLMQLSAASPGGLWQAPSDQCPSPGSPLAHGSPGGPWTMVSHNSLYNSSATSTPQKPSRSRVPSGIRASAAVGTAAVDAQAAEAAHGTEPGFEQALRTAGSSNPVAAPAEWGSQSAVADEEQLHDSVLRSVLGITLAQLQEGADEAVRVVKSVLASLQRQGLASLPGWQLSRGGMASVQEMPPGMLALQEDLRLELRQQCSAQLRDPVIRRSMCGVEGFAALLAIQEDAFMARIVPLVHNMALLP